MGRHNAPDSKAHGAHLGPTGPRWAPCRPHELCYLGQWGTNCIKWWHKTTQRRFGLKKIVTFLRLFFVLFFFDLKLEIYSLSTFFNFSQPEILKVRLKWILVIVVAVIIASYMFITYWLHILFDKCISTSLCHWLTDGQTLWQETWL